MKHFRKEKDPLGILDIPEDALFGIHAFRAKKNFPDTTSFPLEWYRAIGMVKQACYQTYREYKNAAATKYPGTTLPFRIIPDDILGRSRRGSFIRRPF
jgi:aspartate ammonia-lyase